MEVLTGQITFHEVDRSRWDDFETLFENRGGPKNCWCMVWRGSSKERADKETRKSAMKQRVEAEVPIGIIGYWGNDPVAWCSIAPRSTYRDLGGLDYDEHEKVWSIVCFFVPRKYRGQGIMPRLIEAAIEQSRKQGATVVEAYPVNPDSPSYRFMGFVPQFEAAGFEQVGVAGSRRYVMRLKL